MKILILRDKRKLEFQAHFRQTVIQSDCITVF